MQHSSSGFMLGVKAVPSQTQMHGLSQDKYKQKTGIQWKSSLLSFQDIGWETEDSTQHSS